MDITFIGLESVPRAGEERFAGDLLRSPGGGAINAIGVARLGLRAALAVPLGDDLDGRFIRAALEREGIELSTDGRDADADHRGHALGRRARDGHLRAGRQPRAPRRSPRSRRAPSSSRSTSSTSCRPAPAATRPAATTTPARSPATRRATSASARALFVNRREALVITGEDTPEAAAERLGADVEIVVVTLGPEGAMALRRRRARPRARLRDEGRRHHRRRRPAVRRVRVGRPRRRRRRDSPCAGRSCTDHSRSPCPRAPPARSRWSGCWRKARPAACRRCAIAKETQT